MKAALLPAGGFGTRLYPYTKDKAKPLLTVRDKPIIEYGLDKLEAAEVDTAYVITNEIFHSQFENWSRDYNGKIKINLVNNGIRQQSESKGAFYDVQQFIKNFHEDIWIIAPDNIFAFDLTQMKNLAEKVKTSVTAVVRASEIEVLRRCACVALEGTKIKSFEEKPKNPPTNLLCPAIYFIKSEDLEIVRKTSTTRDNLGDVLRVIIEKSAVHAIVYDTFWTDIGTIADLDKARRGIITVL